MRAIPHGSVVPGLERVVPRRNRRAQGLETRVGLLKGGRVAADQGMIGCGALGEDFVQYEVELGV